MDKPSNQNRERETLQFAWLAKFRHSNQGGQWSAFSNPPATRFKTLNKRGWGILSGVLLGLILCGRCAAEEVPMSLINAIHQVETGGRLGAIKGDNGRALGPLQIHRAYWIDSGVEGKYEDCASLDYSIKVLRAYMRRYASAAIKANDLETIARIHNGGPRGYKKAATLGYWQKVRKAMR